MKDAVKVEQTMCFVVRRMGDGRKCDRPATARNSMGKPVCQECYGDYRYLDGMARSLGLALGVEL